MNKQSVRQFDFKWKSKNRLTHVEKLVFLIGRHIIISSSLDTMASSVGNILVGDEIGLIKVVSLGSSSTGKKYSSFGECSRKYGVVGLEKINDHKIASLHVDGTLKLWDFDSISGGLDELSSVNVNQSSSGSQTESYLGMSRVKEVNTSAVVCYSQGGSIKIYMQDEDDEQGVSITEMTSFETSSPVSACTTLAGGIIVGGKENDLKMYDYASQSVVWEAENVPNDNLDLRVPIYITAIDLLRAPTDSVSTGARVTAGTGYKQVRLYDTQAQKAPVHSFDIGDYRVTSLRSFREHQVYVADTAGGLSLWDLRTYRKVQTLKGCVGSIRHMQLSGAEDLLLCVGLDRYLHAYSTDSNKLREKVYVKSRLNCCLSLQVAASGKDRRKNRDKDVEDEDDENDGDEDRDEDDIDEYDDDGDVDGDGDDDNDDDALAEYDDDEPEDESEQEEEEEEVSGKKSNRTSHINSQRVPSHSAKRTKR